MLRIEKEVKAENPKNSNHGNIQSFLESLLVELVAANYRYFLHECLGWSLDEPSDRNPERSCWPPLVASERQLSGLFAQALSNVCPISRLEYPVTRTKSKKISKSMFSDKESVCRVDFFATYDRRSILLELKRSPISTLPSKNKKERSQLKQRWNAVDKQAQQAISYIQKNKDQFEHPIGVGLLVIPIFRAVSKKANDALISEEMALRFPEIVKEISQQLKPDFLAAYTLPREMQILFGYGTEGESERIYPGIVFAAKVRVRSARRTVAKVISKKG